MRTRTIRLLVAVGVLAGCAGCGHRPRIRAVSATSVILAYGDSLTAGTGAGETRSYPAHLAEVLGCRVINAGVPGEDTTAGLARLPRVLRRDPPDLVLLCHGGNDMLLDQDAGTTRRNLDEMISLAKQAGADVILIGVPKPRLLLKAPEFYEALAREHDIPLDAATVPGILRSPSLKSDQVHPNATGYRQLAEALAELIRNSERP